MKTALLGLALIAVLAGCKDATPPAAAPASPGAAPTATAPPPPPVAVPPATPATAAVVPAASAPPGTFPAQGTTTAGSPADQGTKGAPAPPPK